ncbi:MAG: response regulator [Anaerolineae bacterium]
MSITFEDFVEHLRDALAHLYDPTYRPADAVWSVLRCDSQHGIRTLQARLIQAVKDLEPRSDVPPTARIRRLHTLLSLRYLQEFTQERAAEYLGITPRHLRREQKEAIEVLARRLWGASAEGPESPNAGPADRSWRAQLAREMAALRESAPGAVADVGQVIHSAAELEGPLLSERGMDLDFAPIAPALKAVMHPTVLRQLLIAAIQQLAHSGSPGAINIAAQIRDGKVSISLDGPQGDMEAEHDGGFIEETLALHGGTLQTEAKGDRLVLRITLPQARDLTVLVVDDNSDLVHFFRRYAAGTRYKIVEEGRGARVMETVAAVEPDIIVLDVMLPDIDGWELLTTLYESPRMRDIPVIVCSVVREERLALSLGARLYLPKPVRRREFLAALDAALQPGLDRTSVRTSEERTS